MAAPKSTVQGSPRITSRVATLEWEIERLQQKLELVRQIPEDVYENGCVVIFEKQFTAKGIKYTYACVKGGGFWYVTGKPSRYTWDALMDELYGTISEGGSNMAYWVSEMTEIV